MHCALALIVAGFALDPAETYAWPLDLPRVLTSSFAEYRLGRYHMGIDLRTGPVGKGVFAAADGYVSRIRCSPFGYGKAIYLQLDDGNSVVYAHLDDYSPEFRDYVRRAQHDRKQYTVDLYPDAHELPVARGQRIGASGQTGIGVPHLHYEIRDRTGAPINPRGLGITWPDKTAPVFRAVAVVPLDPETTVAGDMLPAVLDVRKLSRSEYIAGPIEVSGPVAFGVDVVDPANSGNTRLGVHTIRTRAGEVKIFEMRHDRVSYEHGQDGVVAYHPFLLQQGRFLMQWRWPGNESEIFYHGAEDGRYIPSGEFDTVTIEALDFHANSATLTIPIVYTPDTEVAEPSSENRESGGIEYDYFPDWLVVSVRFARAEIEHPILRKRGGRSSEASFRRIDDTTFRIAYVPSEDDVEVDLSVLHPRVEAGEDHFLIIRRGVREASLRLGADVQITAGSESAYGTMFVRMDAVEATPGKELQALGPAYRLGHPLTPIDEGLDISFPVPAQVGDSGRVHMYRLGRKGWEFQDTKRQNDRLQIRTRRFGTYAAMIDDTPPRIRRIQPKQGQKIGGTRPTIRATIDDLGSDIDTFTASFNGRWLLMEYDPELESLTWEQDEDLPPGPGAVEFRISDHAGNTAVARVDFEITTGAQ